MSTSRVGALIHHARINVRALIHHARNGITDGHNKLCPYIVVMMMAIIATGCSSDNLADFPGTGDNTAETPVTFSTYTGKSRTRADVGYFVDGVVNATIPSQSNIGIFSWSQRNGDTWTKWAPDNTFDADFMYNQMATAQTVQNNVAELTYSPTRYWPKDTSKQFAFFAYYPFVNKLEVAHNVTVKTKEGKDSTYMDYGDNGISLANQNDLTDKGLKKFHFYVQPTPEKQIDFLVSDYVINYNGTGKEAVSLNLRHTLSQVSISIQLDQDMQRNGARIDESSLEVSLTGAYGEGDLTIGPNSEGKVNIQQKKDKDGNDISGVTSYWETTGDRRDFSTSPSSLSSTTDSRSAVLLMIPQKIEGIGLSVNYDINFYEVDANGDLVVDDKGEPKLLYSYKNNKAEASLKDARDWESGQRFIYNVAVSLQGISVTPEVEEWEDGTSSNEKI